jgi:hypothetical protein
MKVVFLLIVLVGVGLLAMKFNSSSSSSSESILSPTEQGQAARASAKTCTSWTEVLDRIGDPRKWRDDTSNYDFLYIDRFDETTRGFIAEQLKGEGFPSGFSFFYRFSDAATFAVNFNSEGKFSNIQDKEGKGELMDEAGG